MTAFVARLAAVLLVALVGSDLARAEAQSWLKWLKKMQELKNGSFEQDFKHWNRRYKSTSQSNWRFWRPSGHPQPRIVDSSFDNFAGTGGVSLPGFDLDPYCGGKMALVNDLLGGSHQTKLSQRFRLGEQGFGATLRLAWGALLVDGGHSPGDQASFSVRVFVGSSILAQYEATASTGTAGGWTQVGTVNGDPVWFKEDVLEIALANQSPNAKITVELIASDCTQSGHGGCAFIDCVEIVPCTNATGAISMFVPNAFTPDGNGINDTWGPLGVTNATLVEIDVYNRWGGRVFHAAPLSVGGFSGANLSLWDGTLNGSPLPIDVYPYVIRARNCDTESSWMGSVTLIR
jgi:gliding motility-associated-like protein